MKHSGTKSDLFVVMCFISSLTAGFFVLSPTASAQNSEDSASMETRMRLLEERVFGHSDVNGRPLVRGRLPAPSADISGETLVDGSNALLADFSARLGSFERQLRDMTGRLEEAEYEHRQMAEEIKLLRELLQQSQASGTAGGTVEAPAAGQIKPLPAGTRQDTLEAPAPKPEETADIDLPEGSPAQRYDFAFNFIRANDLVKGERAMVAFLEQHSADERAGNAVFWLGRIYLRRSQFGQAAKYFLRLIDEHPTNAKKDEALVDLSEALIGLNSGSDACDALLEFRRIESEASPRLKSRADRLARQAGCS